MNTSSLFVVGLFAATSLASTALITVSARAQNTVPTPALSGETATQGAAVTAGPESAAFQLSIASDGSSVVVDRRTVNLVAGRNTVRFRGVPEGVDLTSVQLTGGIRVLEQRYRYIPTDLTASLRPFVGQTVTVLRSNEPPLSGVLRIADNLLMLETKDGLILSPQGTFVLPRTPNMETPIAALPTLEWVVESDHAGAQPLEAHYAATGLKWGANYRGSLNAAGDRLDLDAFAQVINGSATDFANAQVNLGDALPLPRPLTIPAHTTREVVYYSLHDAPVARDILFETSNFTANFDGAPQVSLHLASPPASEIQLLSGPVTLWSRNAEGTPRRINSTITNGTATYLNIPLGNAPGIRVIRTLVGSRKLNPVTVESTIQIDLSNSTATPVAMAIIEHPNGTFKLSESSVPPSNPVNPDAGRLEWHITIPPKGSQTIKYVAAVHI